MATENKEPRYDRLNTERTQGEWVNMGNYIGVNKTRICHVVGSEDLRIEQDDSNAAYITLAVNNLAKLAQALELLINEIDLSKLNIRKDFNLINAHANAMKALNRIS